MASLEVEYKQIVYLGIQFVDEVEQGHVVLHAVELLLCPFGHVGCLGHECHPGVERAQMTLVAVPVHAVAQSVGYVDYGAGFVEVLSVILVELGQCLFEGSHGVERA